MNKVPWEKSNLEIEVIDVYEGEIIGEEENDYSIEFRDVNMEVKYVKFHKKEFENWPEKIKEGSVLGIVIYLEQQKFCTGVWPREKYWNPKLLE